MDMKESLMNHAEAARDAGRQAEEAARVLQQQANEILSGALERYRMATEYERLAANYRDPAETEFAVGFMCGSAPLPIGYRVFLNDVPVDPLQVRKVDSGGLHMTVVDSRGEIQFYPSGEACTEYKPGVVRIEREKP